MTAEMAMNIGRATAHLFKKKGHAPKIIVGKDTRLSGYMLENALVSGICSMGVNAILVAFPFIDLQGWDDPQAEAAVAMVRRASSRFCRRTSGWQTRMLELMQYTCSPESLIFLRHILLADGLRARGS